MFHSTTASKQEYDDHSMSNECSYSRGRPPTESITRITDWDINDSIIPKTSTSRKQKSVNTRKNYLSVQPARVVPDNQNINPNCSCLPHCCVCNRLELPATTADTGMPQPYAFGGDNWSSGMQQFTRLPPPADPSPIDDFAAALWVPRRSVSHSRAPLWPTMCSKTATTRRRTPTSHLPLCWTWANDVGLASPIDFIGANADALTDASVDFMVLDPSKMLNNNNNDYYMDPYCAGIAVESSSDYSDFSLNWSQ
ncbi:uncharacterized protein LOC126839626 [Adelges cooleyi]|uniref:uncharacterized protein LOC126839626 n=1 Tax=Adelges cooleyi TaxID=133065 RepID=UPI0021801DD0|nr:uncharacterized protein LOC126839626 [Adelges cooleyi]